MHFSCCVAKFVWYFWTKNQSHDSIPVGSYIDIESERKFIVEKMNAIVANIIALFRMLLNFYLGQSSGA